MEAITKQYLDLYGQYSQQLRGRSPLVEHYREEAFDAFARLGLPRFKSEDYQRTDLPTLLSGAQWQLATEALPLAWEATELPEGAFVGTLADFYQQQPELAQEHYGRLAPLATDGLVALNSLLAAEAFVLYLPKGAKLRAPLSVRSLGRALSGQLSAERLLVILEDATEAALVLDEPAAEVTNLVLRTLEIYVGRTARFTLIDREESAAGQLRISSLYVRQLGASHVNLSAVTLARGVTRNNYYISLAEEEADLKVSGFALSKDKGHADNFSYIEHAVPHCTSDELFKYILLGDSRGVFTGRILVAQDAQKTQAYQNNRNLLLSPTARMQSKPQLEIYADDVKCSHGMTTGQLSPEALFYMQQRGIPREEAKLMLSHAFAEDVLERIPLDEEAEAIREHIAEQLR